MKLIDADILKENIEKYRIAHLSHRRLSAIRRESEEVINDMCFAIDVAPIIDPMKHGRWVKAERDGCWSYSEAYKQCSECGKVTFLAKEMNYCPNCGARMDEVERCINRR